ncbi:MAG: tRNA pseudouridine(38-40) synthase TruA [Eubacteriales bacterium]|nr:tRNA pseudouridine(38-40) synthase TruA [Eubacteriales bacterium]
MRNFKIVIQYEGTRYQGWQRQGSTENTLQGKFESLLSRIAGAPVEIAASGRTDAGVHAYGQTASFHMDTQLTQEELLERINRYLPEDVGVISCREMPPRFHARLNAKAKTYRYRIWNSSLPPVFERRLVWQVEERLDAEQMRRAAAFLTGTHDFAAFTSAKNKKKSTVRTIHEIRVEPCQSELVLTFTGDGFLYHMVRILVGTLTEVGLGKREAVDMERILASGDRQRAGMLAPAQGLALMEVFYEDLGELKARPVYGG